MSEQFANSNLCLGCTPIAYMLYLQNPVDLRLLMTCSEGAFHEKAVAAQPELT